MYKPLSGATEQPSRLQQRREAFMHNVQKDHKHILKGRQPLCHEELHFFSKVQPWKQPPGSPTPSQGALLPFTPAAQYQAHCRALGPRAAFPRLWAATGILLIICDPPALQQCLQPGRDRGRAVGPPSTLFSFPSARRDG